jgi:hypothetical protein
VSAVVSGVDVMVGELPGVAQVFEQGLEVEAVGAGLQHHQRGGVRGFGGLGLPQALAQGGGLALAGQALQFFAQVLGQGHAADAQPLELRTNAHAAKGAALNLGLAGLAATAEALHEGASHLPAHEIARLVQRYEDLLPRTRAALAAVGLGLDSAAPAATTRR